MYSICMKKIYRLLPAAIFCAAFFFSCGNAFAAWKGALYETPAFFAGIEGGASSVAYDRKPFAFAPTEADPFGLTQKQPDPANTDLSGGAVIGIQLNRYVAFSAFGTISGDSAFSLDSDGLKGKIKGRYSGAGADVSVFFPLNRSDSIFVTGGVGRYKLEIDYPEPEDENAPKPKSDYYGLGIRAGIGYEQELTDGIFFRFLYRHTEFNADSLKNSDLFDRIDEYSIGFRWVF